MFIINIRMGKKISSVYTVKFSILFVTVSVIERTIKIRLNSITNVLEVDPIAVFVIG